MIKTFSLDLDTIAYNECNILPSIGFLIYPILPDPPTLLQAASLINHSAKLFRRNQLA